VSLTKNRCRKILCSSMPKFECGKCGSKESPYESKEYMRICKNCKTKYSATNGTLFHGVRFGLLKAFRIVKEDCDNDFTSSVTSISKKYKIHRTTARLFLKKIRSKKDEVERLVMYINEPKEGIDRSYKSPKQKNVDKFKAFLDKEEIILKGPDNK